MRRAVLASVVLSCPFLVQGAATITIVNADSPGVGFNDPTPAAPIGGNPGTTIGEQRLRVFERAAQIWGAALNSSVEIRVNASWPSLPCDATSAVVGAAGAQTVSANFPGALRPNTWYPQALANKLFGADTAAPEDIRARFNADIGKPGCLTGRFFYLGLDGNPTPNTVHFLPVLLHELGHGLGFQMFTDPATGEFFAGLPSIADTYLLDKATNQTWATTSSFVRQQSAVNGQGMLVWDGPTVKASAPSVLVPAPQLVVTAAGTAPLTYIAGPSTLGPSLSTPVTGELMPVTSVLAGGNACAPLTGFDAAALNGKIALIDAGGCGVNTKINNAAAVGAKAVILVTTPDVPPINISGFDASVSIPNVSISIQDGTALKNALRFRSRTSSGVMAALSLSPTVRAGADAANRVIMYAPATLSAGSSVSHYDISAFHNLLMEPFTTPDMPLSVQPPADLTLPFFVDLGW